MPPKCVCAPFFQALNTEVGKTVDQASLQNKRHHTHTLYTRNTRGCTAQKQKARRSGCGTSAVRTVGRRSFPSRQGPTATPSSMHERAGSKRVRKETARNMGCAACWIGTLAYSVAIPRRNSGAWRWALGAWRVRTRQGRIRGITTYLGAHVARDIVFVGFVTGEIEASGGHLQTGNRGRADNRQRFRPAGRTALDTVRKTTAE